MNIASILDQPQLNNIEEITMKSYEEQFKTVKLHCEEANRKLPFQFCLIICPFYHR